MLDTPEFHTALPGQQYWISVVLQGSAIFMVQGLGKKSPSILVGLME